MSSTNKMEEEISESSEVTAEQKSAEELAMEAKTELQAMWKVPATAQFVSLFRFNFNLPEIEIEDLEDGFLQENEVGRKVLSDLLIALLRSIRPQRGINADNFEEHLRKQLGKIKETGECLNINLTEEINFYKLDIASKVDLLYALCLSRLDRADVQELLKKMDGEALRVQPLGSDDLGNEYWYFYGTRLYKQEPAVENKKNWKEEWNEQKNQSFNKRGRGRPRKCATRKSFCERDDFESEKSDRRYMNIDEKSRWSVVCNSIEDWVDFAEKFKKSKSKCERALFSMVTDNFLPVLTEIYEEKERKFKEKLKQLIPKPVPRKMETRRMTTRRALEDMNGFDSVNAHKDHLVRDRAHRLEERNRRATQSVERSRSRSNRRSYYDDDEDEYDNDVEESFAQDNSRNYASDEYRQQLMPLISTAETDLKSKVLHVLSEVKLQKDAWPFLYPVEKSYAPGYYEIIQEPMDLSTMSKKVMENSYRTINDIDEDFERMVSNCQLYNGEHSDMSKMVMGLWKVFRKSLSRVFGTGAQDLKSSPPTNKKASTSSQQTDSDSQDSTYGKRKTDSVSKKRKKKTFHKDALETLSKEAQLAVEKSQSSEAMQVDMRDSVSQHKQYSMFSDLKIVPINSHPAALIEKFSSDSSNQDSNDFDNSNDSNSPFQNQSSDSQNAIINETENPETEMQTKQRSAPSIHFITQNDYASELCEFIDKGSPKAFNILSEDVETSADLTNNDDNNLNTSIGSYSSHHSTSPDISGQTRKSPQNTVQNLPRPVVSERNVPLLSDNFGINELSNFPSTYETSTVNASALGLTSNQAAFRKPVPSIQIPMTTSIGTNSQVPFAPATNTSAQVPMNSPNMEPLRTSPTFSTQGPVPLGPQMINQQNQGPVPQGHHLVNQQTQNVQIMKESTQYYQYQKSSMEMAFPSAATVTYASQIPMAPVVTNSSAQVPLQVPVPYSKAFPNQDNLVLQQSEGNKYPNVKFSLPPSTGEILLVPGDPASSSMTFHLFAQPAANPSQPIQSSVELKTSNAASNVEPLPNQQAVTTVGNQVSNSKSTNREGSHIRPQKRKSPLQDLVEPVVQANPLTTSLPSMPKTSGYTGQIRFTDASNPTAYASSASAGMRPMQRPLYNPNNTSTCYSSPNESSNMRNQAPLQPKYNVFQPPVSAQKTMSSIIPSANNILVSTNCNATTTSSVMSRSSNVPIKKIQLSNSNSAMNPNGVIQNANGQLVFIPSSKELVQRSVGGDPSSKMQGLGKPMPQAVTCSPFFPSANNNTVLQSYAFQNAPMNQSQMYTQVVPSQLQPQYVNNNPYYIITDPNAFQNTQRYPVVNMQPISFNNR